MKLYDHTWKTGALTLKGCSCSYFIVNDVEEAKQKAVLLSGCVAATYHLIKNPTTFAQLVQLVREHHSASVSHWQPL